MSLNKLALIRYKTIDQCLTNRARKWTLEDLIEKVSDILYDYEGIKEGVSKRTIQLDIQTMRSDKLGYNAPIIVVDKKYYTYETPKYSITQSKLTRGDLDKMHEVVGILKHLNGFNHFGEMSDMIAKLENNIYRQEKPGKTAIQFESNALLKGIDWLTPAYQAILHQKSVLIAYQSFKARVPVQGLYYPYLLKEYRNRWFLIAKHKFKNGLLNLALDRIQEMTEVPGEIWQAYPGVDFERYFDDTIGVTKIETDQPAKIILQFNQATAPYILTKPIHPSQTVEKEDENGIIIAIKVVMNFELEKEILAFGEQVKVLAPRNLVGKIQRRLEKALGKYAQDKKPTRVTQKQQESPRTIRDDSSELF